MMTSSTAAASSWQLAIKEPITPAPRDTAGTWASDPMKLPIAVRVAATINASLLTRRNSFPATARK